MSGVPLVEAVARACEELKLANRRVLLGVSGGKDSVAMLLALSELAPRLGLVLEAATIDHGLREGSRQDVDFVRRLCDQLGVPFKTVRIDVPRQGSLEGSARRARYRALRELAGPDALIATAHTLEDQAETVLMRLSRGSGLRGMRGILPRRGRIVRPLLAVSRAQVAAFLRERGVRPQVDPTNFSARFTRNRVRALLPALTRALGPSAVEAIARSAGVAAKDERYLEQQAARRARKLLSVEPGAVQVPVEQLNRLPEALRRRVVRIAAKHLGVSLGERHVAAAERALSSPGPCELTLPKGLRLCVRYGVARFGGPASLSAEPPAPFDHVIPGFGQFRVGGAQVEVRPAGPSSGPGWIRLDPQALVLPLRVRSRRPGDRFRTRAGEKKLKKFMIDCKIPREERASVPLLADSAGRILAVGAFARTHMDVNGRRDGLWEVRWELARERMDGEAVTTCHTGDGSRKPLWEQVETRTEASGEKAENK
jgi:tRNA(Ile)-lysidine synthase